MLNMFKRLIKYVVLKIKWHRKVKFDFSTRISLGSIFEGMNQVHSFTTFSGVLGYGSYIGSQCSLNARIGRFSSIGPLVRSNYGRHPYTYPFVSTAPCFFSLNPDHKQNGGTFATSQQFEEYCYSDHENRYGISIGNDCWIGEGVFIVGGVKLSDGVMVMAHAVVTKDIPPYAIVGGVPAKIIGYRYSEEDIRFLLNSKWWDHTPEWFRENWILLSDIDKLKEYYGAN